MHLGFPQFIPLLCNANFLNDIITEVFHPILENELEGNKCLIFFLDNKQQLSSFEHEKSCKLSAKKFTQKNIEDWLNDIEQRFSPKKLSPAFSTADSQSGVADLQYESLKMQFLKHWLRLVSRCM